MADRASGRVLPEGPQSGTRSPSPWPAIGVAALAMVATLPGRSQGIGLFTEPLLKDLGIDRVTYAGLHLWTTLAGSVFALAAGAAFDRWGSKVVSGLMAALGLSVMGLATSQGIGSLVLFLLLLRGLGQSALSTTSLSLASSAAVRRPTVLMAGYSILLSCGFMVAFPLLGWAIGKTGWRETLMGMGGLWVLASLAILGLARGFELGSVRPTAVAGSGAGDFGLVEALATPAFWVIGLSAATYGLAASGIGVFYESILADLGFSKGLYATSLAVTALTGLCGNFLGGWILERFGGRWISGLAMLDLSLCLFVLPHAGSSGAVLLQAAMMGLAGGFVTVHFFSFWRSAFGLSHLGSIQGAAQLLTVVASAVGPLLLASVRSDSGSYAPVFRGLAGWTAVLAVGCLVVPAPRRRVTECWVAS